MGCRSPVCYLVRPFWGWPMCAPFGPGLCLQGYRLRGSYFSPPLVRPLSGSPPLAGSALGRSAPGAPLPGRWGSPLLCFAPPSFSSFFCPSSGPPVGSEVLCQGLLWVPILAQGEVLLRTAKWFHRSGLPEVCASNKSFHRDATSVNSAKPQQQSSC